jgi:hypothetical protein
VSSVLQTPNFFEAREDFSCSSLVTCHSSLAASLVAALLRCVGALGARRSQRTFLWLRTKVARVEFFSLNDRAGAGEKDDRDHHRRQGKVTATRRELGTFDEGYADTV